MLDESDNPPPVTSSGVADLANEVLDTLEERLCEETPVCEFDCQAEERRPAIAEEPLPAKRGWRSRCVPSR